MLPLDVLVNAPTETQIKAVLFDTAKQVGFPVAAWQSGGVADTLLTIFSKAIAPFSRVVANLGRSGFLDLAAAVFYDDGTEDPRWLDLLARSQYRVERLHAAPATGLVKLVNASATPVVFGAGELHVAHAATAKLYTNDAPVTVPASGFASVNVVAQEVGAASNATAGAINVLVTPLPGLSVTNLGPVLGADAETNVELVQSCRDKLATLSPNGPADAYRFWARHATRDDGSRIAVTRAKVTSSHGVVTTTIASASGPLLEEDRAVVEATLQATAMPLGIGGALAANAVAHDVKVVAEVWTTDSTLTPAEVADAVVSRYFPSIPIGGLNLGSGGHVFVEPVEDAVMALGRGILRAEVSLPAAAVPLAWNEVAVCTSLASDFTVNVVPS